MTLQMFTLVLAIILLFVGAELALNAAEKVGKLFNIPPLLIGLLIIGPGTSLPEFFVSHLAALNGQGQMAMGNIVGSNISNLLLVLGISLVIQKITVANKAIFRQISIHLLLSLILSVVLLFSKLHILSCLVLMAFFWGYLGDTYLNMKNQSESKPPGKRALLNSSKENILLFGKLVAGFGLLYYGGEVLVQSGNDLCRLWGISEYMISAIFIALGTSLPELVTSLLTTLRKKNLELIVGNVIGSNILNVAFVMASLIFYHIDLSRGFLAEIFILLTSSFLLLIFSLKKWALNRPLGLFLIVMYAGIVYHWAEQG